MNENTLMNDFMINLNLDNDRSIYLVNNEMTFDHLFLNNKELKKLKHYFILNKKDLILMKEYTPDCSICFDALENKKKVIKLPLCDHMFHWKYI